MVLGRCGATIRPVRVHPALGPAMRVLPLDLIARRHTDTRWVPCLSGRLCAWLPYSIQLTRHWGYSNHAAFRFWNDSCSSQRTRPSVLCTRQHTRPDLYPDGITGGATWISPGTSPAAGRIRYYAYNRCIIYAVCRGGCWGGHYGTVHKLCI